MKLKYTVAVFFGLFFLVLAIGLLIVSPQNIRAWGSTTPRYDTHQFIDRTAYQCLVTKFSHDAAFFLSIFPTVDQILTQEGNSLATGGGGNGPDVDGNSLYSQHWFNPTRGSGGTPGAVYDFALLFVQSKRTDLRAAAYSAHFMADMSTPVHLNGVMRDVIRGIYDTQTSRGTDPAAAVTLDENITGFQGRATPTRNWRTEIERFFANTSAFNDFFDPWYWDSMISTINSTHALWERQNPQHQSTFGCHYDLSWINGTPTFDKIEEAYAKRAKAYTVHTAEESKLNQEEWQLRDPQTALDHAIESVLTLWRGSFSALRPDMEIRPLSGSEGKMVFEVTGVVENLDGEDRAGNVQAKLTVEDSKGKKIYEESQGNTVGDIDPKTKQKTPTPWKVEIEPAAISPGKIKFKIETIGSFRQSPDLQYALKEREIKPVENSILILMDCSGSMQGTKIENTKASAQKTIDTMDEKSEVAILAFSDCPGNIRVICPFTAITAASKTEIKAKILALSAGGGTPLAAATRYAGGYLRSFSIGRNLNLIILSDGEETCQGKPADEVRNLNQ